MATASITYNAADTSWPAVTAPIAFSTGTHGETITPKSLRKQARKIEKAEKRAKRERKARKAGAKRKHQDREAVRSALLRVASDDSKGYASVDAARALNELGMV